MPKVVLRVEHSRSLVESILRPQIEAEDFEGFESFGFDRAYDNILILLTYGTCAVSHNSAQPGEAHSTHTAVVTCPKC
jgi:hypothetical protein